MVSATLGPRWTRDEVLLVFHLYVRLPFAHQHPEHSEVLALAEVLGRTAEGVVMKCRKFSLLDPEERPRHPAAQCRMTHVDEALWADHARDPERVGAQAEALWRARVEGVTSDHDRLGHAFFQRTVLANFAGRCAVTGLRHAALVNVSHLVSGEQAPRHRVDPRNGIALNRTLAAVFDRHLVTFDEHHRFVVGRRLRESLPREVLAPGFLAFAGRRLRPGLRHYLSPALLERHRQAFVESER